jgi:hypothetical protein
MTVLTQIALGASLDLKLRASAARLVMLELVIMRADGLRVTALGAQHLAAQRGESGELGTSQEARAPDPGSR